MLQALRPVGPDRRFRGLGADHRRERHGQGGGRPGPAPAQPAAREAVRRRELSRPCPIRCWRASCSGTSRGRSPTPAATARGFSSRPRAGRCFSTKSARCRWRCSPSCCGPWRRARSGRSAARRKSPVDVRDSGRHQPRPGDGRRRGPLPQGPLLPHRRHSSRPAAAAGPRSRRPAPGAALHRALRRPGEEASARPFRSAWRRSCWPTRWPGNVRELRNVIERAVALTRFDKLTLEDLPEKIRDYRSSQVVIGGSDPGELVPLEEVERRYILHVLECVQRQSHPGRQEARARPQDALPQAAAVWCPRRGRGGLRAIGRGQRSQFRG